MIRAYVHWEQANFKWANGHMTTCVEVVWTP